MVVNYTPIESAFSPDELDLIERAKRIVIKENTTLLMSVLSTLTDRIAKGAALGEDVSIIVQHGWDRELLQGVPHTTINGRLVVSFEFDAHKGMSIEPKTLG